MRNTKNFLTKYGSWALVTGASSGIGREAAIALAKAGFNLVLVARNRSAMDELTKSFEKPHDIEVRVVTTDLAQANAVEEILAVTNGLDVGLAVLAAGFGSSVPFIQSDLSNELSMLDVNCRAVLALAWHFGRQFARQKRGGIVLFNSLLAFQGVPTSANYAATKAYIQSLAEALHVELKPFGVDVLAAAPGPVNSGFASHANLKYKLAQSPADVAQATLSALGRKMTLRPGGLSKFLELSLKPLPRWGRVRVMGKIMGGMAVKRA